MINKKVLMIVFIMCIFIVIVVLYQFNGQTTNGWFSDSNRTFYILENDV